MIKDLIKEVKESKDKFEQDNVLSQTPPEALNYIEALEDALSVLSNFSENETYEAGLDHGRIEGEEAGWNACNTWWANDGGHGLRPTSKMWNSVKEWRETEQYQIAYKGKGMGTK